MFGYKKQEACPNWLKQWGRHHLTYLELQGQQLLGRLVLWLHSTAEEPLAAHLFYLGSWLSPLGNGLTWFQRCICFSHDTQTCP